jgi:hypothetical protein
MHTAEKEEAKKEKSCYSDLVLITTAETHATAIKPEHQASSPSMQSLEPPTLVLKNRLTCHYAPLTSPWNQKYFSHHGNK